MTDPSTTRIEDLEVSVRTSAFLASLELADLGALLSRATIAAPKMVIAELRLLLEELGVCYTGQWETVEADQELQDLSGDVPSRWEVIAEWLGENHPSALVSFNAGARQEAIDGTERDIGRVLPEEFKDFVKLHDGQTPGGPMVHTCSLLTLKQIVSTHRRLAGLFKNPKELEATTVAEEIQPVEHSAAWIPIGVSARGRDFLCLDLSPAGSGHVGQVILTAVDDDARELVATGFADLLSRYFRELQTGEIELE